LPTLCRTPALLARAWTLLASSINPKPEKKLDIASHPATSVACYLAA